VPGAPLFFFEVFSQRGSTRPALAAHDSVAVDCYTQSGRPRRRSFEAAPEALTYMEHGILQQRAPRRHFEALPGGDESVSGPPHSPGIANSPWQSVFRTSSHNLQADLVFGRKTKTHQNRSRELRRPSCASDNMSRGIRFAKLAAVLLASWFPAKYQDRLKLWKLRAGKLIAKGVAIPGNADDGNGFVSPEAASK